ncbi:hypothetical protein BBP40_003130 [Aspergillus hancockii]|nr:hypothetical protein BBP40_003130 [Aspergillus hancockii]
MFYILRFFAGLFESGTMPGAFYVIRSWYRSSDISRRPAIFMFSSAGGRMFSGYIQSGLYDGLPKRWVFIFDFIIGIPVTIFGFFCCPEEPKSARIWWMTENERQISIKRLAGENRDAVQVTWNLSSIKRILSSRVMQGACGVDLQRWMTLYLKSLKVDGHLKYSVEKINNLLTVIGYTELVWILLSATLMDLTQSSPIILLGCEVVQLYAYIVFLVWSDNEAFMMATYYICSAYGAIGPLIIAWLNSKCGADKQLRALTTSLMISLG